MNINRIVQGENNKNTNQTAAKHNVAVEWKYATKNICKTKPTTPPQEFHLKNQDLNKIRHTGTFIDGTKARSVCYKILDGRPVQFLHITDNDNFFASKRCK